MKYFELLSPGGDLESIKAAIVGGANAIYFGIERFNARNRATNIHIDDLGTIVSLIHQYECRAYLTLNILITEDEVSAFIATMNRIQNIPVDGIIVQDFGVANLLNNYYPHIQLHASTQMTTHNTGQLQFLKKLNFKRVNLCRELNLNEISDLTKEAHNLNIKTEVFIHGAYCISFSGQCYLSSFIKGRSGNRGRCSQLCRSQYKETSQQKNYPLNLKDNCAIDNIEELHAAKIDSLKIEGRIKKPHYVFSITKEWHHQIDEFYNNKHNSKKKDEFYKLFNRDFSNAFLNDNINKYLFIDNPRDHSAQYMTSNKNINITKAKKDVYNYRTGIIKELQHKIGNLSNVKHSSNSQIHKTISIPNKKIALRIIKKPSLLVFISDKSDIHKITKSNVDILYEIPNKIDYNYNDIISTFNDNPQTIPYFPSILIDKSFINACQLLKEIKPKKIITDNTGIAFEAYKQDIPWIAGPYMNILNSYSMECLKENFNCAGSFISNEISLKQIKRITPPSDFSLYYSIYHPIKLMTSKACLFFTTSGCHKKMMDKDCYKNCQKSSFISDMENHRYFIHKDKNNYSSLYNNLNYLNLSIKNDLKDFFNSFLIDLRDIDTETEIKTSKEFIVNHFIKLIGGDPNAAKDTLNHFGETTMSQYENGI